MSPRRRSGKKIDFVHWTLGSASEDNFSAGVAADTLFAAQHLSETLLRMRGHWTCHVRDTLTPPQSALMAVGIILVPEGTGTTVLWSPFTDADAPWIWIDYAVVGYFEPVADVIDVPGLSHYRSNIDNKAMRIIRNQETQVVWENTTIGGATSLNNRMDIRALFGT